MNTRYAGHYIGTVARAPDGRVACRVLGGVFRRGVSFEQELRDAFGGLRAHDIGKEIHRVHGVLQMENDEQRGRRMGVTD